MNDGHYDSMHHIALTAIIINFHVLLIFGLSLFPLKFHNVETIDRYIFLTLPASYMW